MGSTTLLLLQLLPTYFQPSLSTRQQIAYPNGQVTVVQHRIEVRTGQSSDQSQLVEATTY